ncbi:MAG: zinc ribbon domain-containing protein [Methanobacterium sp.]|nr:zinc ribbon domain-containing protein [Methanobacterium sp.]
MAKICPNCNTKNSNNAEFCQGCGQELENVPQSTRSFPIILIIIIIVAVGVPLYFVWSFVIGPSMNENYLEQNGINGTAEILDAQQTQTFVNNNPEIKMTLLVSVPGKEPYKVTYKTVVPMVDLSKVQPGNKWYVLVDPKDPQNVIFA